MKTFSTDRLAGLGRLAFCGLAMLMLLQPGVVLGQQERSPEEMRALAEKLAAAGQPGPEHDRLAAMAGEWDVEMTLWPQPGAEPIVVQGRVTAEPILGGRFLVQKLDVEGAPVPIQGMTIFGFDRRSGEYTTIGLDTSGTYWVTARGVADESGDRVVLSGKDWDPIFEFEQNYDIGLEWVDEDTFVTWITFKDPVHTRGGDPHTMVRSRSTRRR